MGDTIFSKIINKEIKADIVYEDDELLAFKDVNPQAPVHVLIIPKIEIKTLNDLEAKHHELAGKIVHRASLLAKEFGIDESGYRIVMNCNEGGGQSVFHIHCHLLGGRKMNWPPG